MSRDKFAIVALFGKSGAGKDTVEKLLLQSPYSALFHGIVSCTTRPIRDNETADVDYHYLTREEFTERMLRNEFIEALEFNGWFYGATVTELDPKKINIGIFTPEGVKSLLNTKDEYNLKVLPIYIKACDKTRIMRTLEREDNPNVKEICRRFFADEEDFKDINYFHLNLFNDRDSMTDFEIVDTMLEYSLDFFD